MHLDESLAFFWQKLDCFQQTSNLWRWLICPTLIDSDIATLISMRHIDTIIPIQSSIVRAKYHEIK